MSVRLHDDRPFLLGRALDSLADAIMLLEWRYDDDAVGSVARLERLRDELRLARTLLESSERLH